MARLRDLAKLRMAGLMVKGMTPAQRTQYLSQQTALDNLMAKKSTIDRARLEAIFKREYPASKLINATPDARLNLMTKKIQLAQGDMKAKSSIDLGKDLRKEIAKKTIEAGKTEQQKIAEFLKAVRPWVMGMTPAENLEFQNLMKELGAVRKNLPLLEVKANDAVNNSYLPRLAAASTSERLGFFRNVLRDAKERASRLAAAKTKVSQPPMVVPITKPAPAAPQPIKSSDAQLIRTVQQQRAAYQQPSVPPISYRDDMAPPSEADESDNDIEKKRLELETKRFALDKTASILVPLAIAFLPMLLRK